MACWRPCRGRGSPPGLVRFQLAAVTCEGLQAQGLRWLQGARQGRGAMAGRVPRYRPWKAGAEALAEIGIGGLPDDWPAHAAVYGCSSIDRRHWLLLLPERAQLWLGWSG